MSEWFNQSLIMQGPSIRFSSDDDESIDMNGHRDSRPMFKLDKLNSINTADLLINKRKVSSDVLSFSGSSMPSSKSASEAGTETSEYTDGDEDDFQQPQPNMGNGHGRQDSSARIQFEKQRLEEEIKEKKEILYQMERLESKGYTLPRKFNMQSDLEEMRVEYERVVREKEVDASIRFQRKMLMACVTGIEFLNGRFDPFEVKLDGWSEQVHENVNDYDDIFEELHDKHKSTGRKMAPELRLLLSLSGSAFMFHLTQSVFKQQNQTQPLPGVEHVLRSNPELLRQFQQAAVNQINTDRRNNEFAQQAPPPPPQQRQQQQQQQQHQQQGMSMFGMMDSIFGGSTKHSGNRPAPPAPPAPRGPTGPTVENINIHTNHSNGLMNQNQYETMSISDEEITSIIEDTADMVGILGNKRASKQKPGGNGSKRTLAL